ncbi:hypothetical protein N7462_007195 [Penicillium macrosclerotiorum]|uniref:uncharacterized protein n=1 Tax=Penicillium macrosclerotiorum TaxID=303699 RepID=UPI002546D227|nr:uncharacterized protein N7462_007195 [Penicillium macrosclerotiorum]KAJ5678951.1 hypothetical protein N7462_007195 [Penicillium macrosclerotiorum]
MPSILPKHTLKDGPDPSYGIHRSQLDHPFPLGQLPDSGSNADGVRGLEGKSSPKAFMTRPQTTSSDDVTGRQTQANWIGWHAAPISVSSRAPERN